MKKINQKLINESETEDTLKSDYHVGISSENAQSNVVASYQSAMQVLLDLKIDDAVLISAWMEDTSIYVLVGDASLSPEHYRIGIVKDGKVDFGFSKYQVSFERLMNKALKNHRVEIIPMRHIWEKMVWCIL